MAVAVDAASSTHWAGIFTSAGTVGAAVLAGVGLLIAVNLANKDRTDADRRLDAERGHTRQQAARQFEAQLLLKAGDLFALGQAGNPPQDQYANAQLRAVLHALPETVCTFMRGPLGMGPEPGSAGFIRMQDLLRYVLGHSSAVVTLQTYAHLWPGDDDRTRAVIDSTLDVLRTSCGLGDRPASIDAGQEALGRA